MSKKKSQRWFVFLPLESHAMLFMAKQAESIYHDSISEWLEFSPYETGFAKYGTFMKTEQFGCKYFGGRILKRFEEPDLSYLQGKCHKIPLLSPPLLYLSCLLYTSILP